MHEYEITQNIIRIAEDEAKKHGAAKITMITLVIGELSSIVDECIYMYFETLAKDTLCSNANLKFERVNAILRCDICKNEFLKNKDITCPKCGSLGSLTDIGREFYIKSIEVE